MAPHVIVEISIFDLHGPPVTLVRVYYRLLLYTIVFFRIYIWKVSLGFLFLGIFPVIKVVALCCPFLQHLSLPTATIVQLLGHR